MYRYYDPMLYVRAVFWILVGVIGGLVLTWSVTVQAPGFQFLWPVLIAGYIVAGGIYKAVDAKTGAGYLLLIGLTFLTVVTFLIPWNVWSHDPKTAPINVIVAFVPFVWALGAFLKHTNPLWPLPIIGVLVGGLFGLLHIGGSAAVDAISDLASYRREKKPVTPPETDTPTV